MKRSITQILWTLMMVIAITLSFSAKTYAQDKIGHVIFTTGELIASNNGKARRLKRGSSIWVGDIVRSSRDTLSQIRMKDNALIALKPNTEFGFDQYRFSDKPENNSSIFSLIKGGFRTITGLIGKHNKKHYKVKTSVATIGVRGTHYGLTLCQQSNCSGNEGGITDGLYGSVIDGEIVTKNEAGEFSFSNDEYFHIASISNKPENLLKPPGNIFNQPKLRKKLKKMNEKNHMAGPHERQGLPPRMPPPPNQPGSPIPGSPIPETAISPLLPAKTGDAFAFTFFDASGGAPLPVFDKIISDGTGQNGFALNATAAQNGLFIPMSAIQTIGVNKRTLFLADANPVNVGSFTIPVAGATGIKVGWGRWAGNFVATENDVRIPTPGSLHYVVANNIFNPANLGTLSAIGTATYSVVGGTRPTDLAGNVASNLATINMTVDFGAGMMNLGINTSVAGNTYSATSGLVTASAALTGGLTLSGTAACANCIGQANVALIGPQAEGAAALYMIRNPNATNPVTGAATGNSVNGAAVLAR